MNIIIKNESLSVGICPLGAEMRFIKDSEGTQFLWQGDPEFWSGHAPNLFPYIGRLTDKTYRYDAIAYHMGIHGFVSGSVFTVEELEQDRATFVLSDDEKSRIVYPFAFKLRISYHIAGSCLFIHYTVENKDDKTMYFGLGGHPGFLLPFENGLKFEDYDLEFDQVCQPVRIGLSETCFCTGDDTSYPLLNGRKLPLSHGLFDNDAIVLRGMAQSVTLKSRKGTKAVRVSYPDMRYLGLWHMPGTQAPYVCIEPWTSLPSRHGIIEDISKQKDLISLSPDAAYNNEWRIEVLSKNK